CPSSGSPCANTGDIRRISACGSWPASRQFAELMKGRHRCSRDERLLQTWGDSIEPANQRRRQRGTVLVGLHTMRLPTILGTTVMLAAGAPVAAQDGGRPGWTPSPEDAAEVQAIISEAARLPLSDAAYSLWRQRFRLDSLEGRPTAEEIRINRTLTPE